MPSQFGPAGFFLHRFFGLLLASVARILSYARTNSSFFGGGIVKSVTLFCFAVTLIFGATAAACVADDKADLQAIYGYWSLTSGVSKGEAMSEDTKRTVLLRFADGEYFSRLSGKTD
jgi:hypothetical protein